MKSNDQRSEQDGYPATFLVSCSATIPDRNRNYLYSSSSSSSSISIGIGIDIGNIISSSISTVSYTHLTLPTIYSV